MALNIQFASAMHQAIIRRLDVVTASVVFKADPDTSNHTDRDVIYGIDFHKALLKPPVAGKLTITDKDLKGGVTDFLDRLLGPEKGIPGRPISDGQKADRARFLDTTVAKLMAG